MFGGPCAQKLMIWSRPMLEATRLEEPWCHPFSPWDAQKASSRVQSKKETTLIIDTKHGRLLRSRCLRQSKNNGTDHWSHATCWWINGDDLQAEDAQQDAPKTTRSRSSTSSDRFVRSHCYHQYSARPQNKIVVYFWIFKSPMKFRFQRIKNESIEVSYKKLWPKHWRSCTLKFSGQHATLK